MALVPLMASAPTAFSEPSASSAVLKSALGDSIEIPSSSSPLLRYCPDNTCETFRAPRKADSQRLADFALLYLWYVSQYYVLKDWHAGPVPEQVHVVRKQYSGGCRSEGEIAHAKCALLSLASTAAIRVTFVRYDEGAENKVPVDLNDELKRLR